MIYGYARVSTLDQKLDQQLHDLQVAGAEKIFSEKVSSSKSLRPQLTILLNQVKEGDIILVTRLDRFARTAREALQLIAKLVEKKVGIKSLTQSWLDTTNPNDPSKKLILHIFTGFAEFERDLIQERVKEGLAEARRQGRIGGRKPLSFEKQNLIAKLWDSGKGETKMGIARNLGIGIKAVRKYCKGVPKIDSSK